MLVRELELNRSTNSSPGVGGSIAPASSLGTTLVSIGDSFVLQQRALMRGIKVARTADQTVWHWYYKEELSPAFPSPGDAWGDALLNFAFISPGELACESRTFNRVVIDGAVGPQGESGVEVHEERLVVRCLEDPAPYQVFRMKAATFVPDHGRTALPLGDIRQVRVKIFTALGMAVEHVADLLKHVPRTTHTPVLSLHL